MELPFQTGSFESSSFPETGNPLKLSKMDGHCWIGIGKKVVFKFFLSNHCNVSLHFEIFDTEVGRNEIVRGC